MGGLQAISRLKIVFLGICGKPTCAARRCRGLILVGCCGGRSGEVAVARSAACKPSCDDCFFGCNLLCALPDREPCATYRPNHPDGLRPPQQLRFVFRSERARAVWAFPSAQEQAALHA
jgi:hypothetical protein